MTRYALGVVACLLVYPVLAGAQDETDQRVKLARVLGTPGGTSPADMSRPGFETILESKGDDTDVSIRAGVKLGAFLFDGTIRSDVDKDDSVSRVLAADREPLSSTGSFALGLTYTSGLNFESDPSAMLAVCGNRTPCATNNKDLPDDVREKLRSMIRFKTARTFGIKTTITRPSFKYRLTANGADVEDERHTGVATTAGFGILWPAKVYAGVAAGYERARSAAGDATTLCQTLPDLTTVSQCAETVLGAPVEKDGAVVAIVLRYISPRFIVAPRFEYRETKNVKNLDIPVYFVPEADGAKLTGGVMYRVKNGDSSVSAFVGTAVPAFKLPF